MTPRRALAAALLALVLSAPWWLGAPRPGDDVPFSPPSAAHWLGTDGQGQDVARLLVLGAGPSLALAAVTGAMTVALGAAVAVTAAVRGGRVAAALAVATDVVLVLPGLPLLVLLAAWLPPGPVTMGAVLAGTGWAWTARVLAAPARVVAASAYVQASVQAGEAWWRVALVEVLPVLGLHVGAGLLGATVWALGAEVGLEFLGLGDPTAVTWGTTLYWAVNDAAVVAGAWWVFLPVGLVMATTAAGLTAAQAALERRFDPAVGARAALSAAAPHAVVGVTPVVDPREST